MKKNITYSDFLPIWKNFIRDAGTVLNSQMVAHHFYNLALETMLEQARPTITKIDDRVVAVTLTDPEHRVTKVLWQAPKPLSEEKIENLREYHGINDWLYETSIVDFARAIEKEHGIK